MGCLALQVHAIKSELTAMGTSLEQDVAALGSSRGVEAAAAAFRAEKKRLLAGVLQLL